MSAINAMPDLAQLLRDFFLKHLSAQMGASPRTLESYRDAFRLFFLHCEEKTGRRPAQLELADVDAPLVLGFLEWLEKKRGNSVRSRNARLAALKSFLNYAAGRVPESLPSIRRALAVPTKRCDKPLLGYLSLDEVEAVLGEAKRSRWTGTRDYVLLQTAYNTGARVSELVGMTIGDVDLQRNCVRILGKGRKLREVPLWPKTMRALRDWIRHSEGGPNAPVFPSRAGQRMSRSNVEKRLKALVATAASACPSLIGRRISPHTLRHTMAMHMLQSGTDVSVIALWLGHASPVTTNAYLEADLSMKERALQKLPGPKTAKLRFRPSDRLLVFLDQL